MRVFVIAPEAEEQETAIERLSEKRNRHTCQGSVVLFPQDLSLGL